MNGEKQFLRVAKIIGVHGLHGRLRIAVYSDITERFEPGSGLFLKLGADYNRYVSSEFIGQNRKASLLKLEGIDDRDEALSFKGVEIFIEKAHAEKTRDILGDNAFYYYDLIGCKAFWNDRPFADVNDIIKGGSGDILILLDENGTEYMIPFIESMVDTQRIGEGRIDINPVDGLFES